MKKSRRAARFLSTMVGAGVMSALCNGTQAQTVHKCQSEGRTVFQSAPCAVEATAPTKDAPAPAAEGAASKKKTLAEMLRERDGADRPRAQGREFQGDGAHVLRARMGAV